MLVGLLMEGQPYWLEPKVVDHHDEPHMNGILDPVCHPPSMWVT
jgi:hypothetical protein